MENDFLKQIRDKFFPDARAELLIKPSVARERTSEGTCGGTTVLSVSDLEIAGMVWRNGLSAQIEKLRQKFEEGTIGLCSSCGNPIEVERLETMLSTGVPMLDCFECHKRNPCSKPVFSNPPPKKKEPKEAKNLVGVYT